MALARSPENRSVPQRASNKWRQHSFAETLDAGSVYESRLKVWHIIQGGDGRWGAVYAATTLTASVVWETGEEQEIDQSDHSYAVIDNPADPDAPNITERYYGLLVRRHNLGRLDTKEVMELRHMEPMVRLIEAVAERVGHPLECRVER
jgi:hypothetical protein